MKIIEQPTYEILTPLSDDGLKELIAIERAARTCYKSEGRMTNDGYSAMKLVRDLIKNGHEAMLEHGGMTVKFTCDRGVSHELVRHRMASYAQESTRYCNYSKIEFGHEIAFIRPLWAKEDTPGGKAWREAMLVAEDVYFELLDIGHTAQEARAVLPNSLKTEVVVTANWREWRHIFRLRCDNAAHPEMRRVMTPLLREMKQSIPELFLDIPYVVDGGGCGGKCPM